VIAGGVSVALMVIISQRVTRPNAPVTELLWNFAALVLLDSVLSFLSGYISIRLAQKTHYDLRIRLGRQILGAPLRRLEEAGTDRVLAAATHDIPAIAAAFLNIPQLCISLAVFIGSIVYLSWLSLPLFLVLAGFIIMSGISFFFGQRYVNFYRLKGREVVDTLFGHFHALVEGAKELRLHRRRRNAFSTDSLEFTAKNLWRHEQKGMTFSAILNSWNSMLFFATIGLILFAAPIISGNPDAQLLTAFALAVFFMRGPLMSILAVVPVFNQAGISLRKIEELGFSFAPVDVTDMQSADAATNDSWGRIDIEGVTHTYMREQEDSSFTLGPINLTVHAGELLFIVGGNGSGKTTLAKLMTGLYTPESGTIHINGDPVTDANRDDFRQYFSAIFSDFFLFESLMGLESPQLQEQAEGYLARLQLQHKIRVEGGKLSTTKSLSFGQRKRLALLTAYLEDRPIYVFDEWASGQDPTFKDVFYNTLLPDLKNRGKTVIVISHDDRYFHIADRVIKLDDGQVVASGSPGESVPGLVDSVVAAP
jgi:putative ATP-binding cassette transporter